jgi:hypothetical protein
MMLLTESDNLVALIDEPFHCVLDQLGARGEIIDRTGEANR